MITRSVLQIRCSAGRLQNDIERKKDMRKQPDICPAVFYLKGGGDRIRKDYLL